MDLAELADVANVSLAKWFISRWYAVEAAADEHSSKIYGFYASSAAANAACPKIGWYGDGKVKEVFVLTIDGKSGYIVNPAVVYDAEDREAARNAALAKLTDYEKKLLALA